MEAWLSWAVFLALGGALYWYYSQKPGQAKQRGRSTQRTTTTSSGKGDTQWIDSESSLKLNNKAAKPKAPRKSVKKAVQEVGDKVAATLSSPAASSNSADADDDSSPAASPTLGASTGSQIPSGRDVSDMLESRGPAPGVLRINPSEMPARQSKPQPQRAESSQETKKQRQNRRKVEEAKAQREADEKQRQILLEQQRRTARIARNEPAKNGLQPVQPPSSNPWTTAGSSSGAKAPAPQHGQLLDTFDPDAASTASSSEAATNGTAPTPDSLSGNTHWNNLPSEEEQMRMAMEESAWTTVPKGKKQKKNKNAAESTGDEISDPGVPQEAAPVQPVQTKRVENVQPRSRYDILSEPTSNAPSNHPMDSDWPVV